MAMSRTNSSPGNFDASIDRPMRIAEIYVAAEHALRKTISNEDLWKSLSSMIEFEVFSTEEFLCLPLYVIKGAIMLGFGVSEPVELGSLKPCKIF